MNEQQAAAALAAWTQSIDAAYAQATAAPAPPPEPTFLESVGEGIEDVVNGAASIGQAALDNPGAVVELAGGLALAGGGYALATAGGVVSASGVGAIAGVPAAGAGWVIGAAGTAAALDGARRLAEAASQNPAEPMQVNWGDQKKTKETNEKIDKHQGDSSGSHSRQQDNINQDPSHATPLFRQKAEEAEKKSGWRLW